MRAEDYTAAVERYRTLVQQGAQHFAALRDAGTSRRSAWEPNFQRAFLVFSALWRYQREHRASLTEAGLRRWEVGDIACKLGQLYYSYYLHTAETRYLLDAAELFAAVQERGYFTGLERDAFLAGKKLRFYGRYVVAALMAGRPGAAVNLADEMEAALQGGRLAPEVRGAWQATLNEVRSFMQAVRGVQGSRSGLYRFAKAPRQGRLARSGASNLQLSAALLLGSQVGGTRIAELSLDVFRMMQILEFEIGEHSALHSSSNPLKQLLFEPDALEVVASLATLWTELPQDSVVLIYLPGDFLHRSGLGPQDLVPFIRRPLFLIVDGRAPTFESLCRRDGGEPAILLESGNCRFPVGLGNKDGYSGGDGDSLFALFLSRPALGFCALVEGDESLWEANCKAVQDLEFNVAQVLDEWWAALLASPPQDIEPAWARVLDDPFLGQLALNFAFARAVLTLYGSFTGEPPACSPELPLALAPSCQAVRRAVASLAQAAGCAELFAPAD